MIWKRSNESVWSYVFWYVKVSIFWKCIQYTIHWDKTKMFKKFLSDKINLTKGAFFFLSWAPTRDSFTFNSQFLYQLKQMAHFSKTVSVSKTVFHSVSFLLNFIFLFNKKNGLFDVKEVWYNKNLSMKFL